MDDCIFCKIINGTLDSQILYEDGDVMCFLDRFPVNIGHALLVPKQHVDRYEHASPEIVGVLAERLRVLAPKIINALGAKGYNLALNSGEAAGQVVPHLHWHIIPRYTHDELSLWPNKQTTPEALQDVASKLKGLSL